MGNDANHVTTSPSTAFPRRRPNWARVSGLRGLHREFSRGLCASELLEGAADLICDTIQVEDCTILELLPETGKVCQRAVRGWPRNYELPLDFQWSAHFTVAIESGEPVLVHWTPDHFETALPGTTRRTTSALLVPVLTGDNVSGVVGVFTKASRDFSPSQIDFVQSLSDFIALILQREKTQRALRESELKYELLVEGSDDLFFYSHDNLHIVQYASPSLQRVLGYAPDEVIGHLSEEFFSVDPTNDIAIELTDIALHSGIRQRPYLAVLRHKNGQRVILETTEAPIVQDGRVVGMQGFARDVTERVNEQKDYVERTLHLNALIQYSPLGIVVLDSEDRVKICNPAFEELFQVKQSQILGASFATELLARDTILSEPEGFAVGFKPEGWSRAEKRLRRRDGQILELELLAVPLVAVRERVGSFVLCQDVSFRKQAERSVKEESFRLLQAQNEERRRIARDLHDSTGQILAALTMNLGALAHSCAGKLSNAEKKRLLDSFGLAEQCARELRTASYLLRPPLLEKAGLSSALKWYTAGFSSRSGIKVNLHLPPDLERLPRKVEVALFRIIQEALTNVHRHSQSSTARIRLELDDNLLHLEISDRGIGLSQRRTDKDNEIASSGVGISGMLERVRELGGNIEISSRKGTAIRAVLPLSAQA